MEKLTFDSGIKEYRINEQGVLRFNPSDPNVYARFLQALDQIKALEQELIGKAQAIEKTVPDTGAAVLRLMQEADKRIKAVLSEVFGEGNDFDRILGGVNLLAVAGNGKRVISNLLEAIQPVITEGAASYAKLQTEAAVAKAERSRQQRAKQ